MEEGGPRKNAEEVTERKERGQRVEESRRVTLEPKGI